MRFVSCIALFMFQLHLHDCTFTNTRTHARARDSQVRHTHTHTHTHTYIHTHTRTRARATYSCVNGKSNVASVCLHFTDRLQPVKHMHEPQVAQGGAGRQGRLRHHCTLEVRLHRLVLTMTARVLLTTVVIMMTQGTIIVIRLGGVYTKGLGCQRGSCGTYAMSFDRCMDTKN